MQNNNNSNGWQGSGENGNGQEDRRNGVNNVPYTVVYPVPATTQNRPVRDPRRSTGPVRRHRRPVGPPLPKPTNGYYFSFGEETQPARQQPMPQQVPIQPMPQQMPIQPMPQQMPIQPMPQQMPIQPIPQHVPVQSTPQQVPDRRTKPAAQPQSRQTMPPTVGHGKTQHTKQTAESRTVSSAAQNAAAKGRIPGIGKRIRDSIIMAGLIGLITLCSMIMLPSGGRAEPATAEQKSFFEDLDAEMLGFRSDSLSYIFSIPKIYVLPWGEQPAPVPNAEGFGSQEDENGNKVLTYVDETISVRYWKERIYDSNVHLAEIEVAHPTQLRTAYAGGEFGSSKKYMPQVIAQQVNAVIAVNGDYCGYRTGGIIVRQNNLYRNTARGWDTLLIDSDGDFHIMQDKNIHASGIMDEYKIVNSLAFGPSLVVDGEIKILNIASGCGVTWNNKYSPRTAVGQIGRLHYLFCCVEGRSEASQGVTTPQMAKIMYNKGCVQAYNLDGGQSTTMILNGKAMNKPLWGSQRVVTDIIYCATAIPDIEGETVNE